MFRLPNANPGRFKAGKRSSTAPNASLGPAASKAPPTQPVVVQPTQPDATLVAPDSQGLDNTQTTLVGTTQLDPKKSYLDTRIASGFSPAKPQATTPLELQPIVPPTSNAPGKSKARAALVSVARNTDEHIQFQYHRGKRSGSRAASSRAGSRPPSQSPAPSIVELPPTPLPQSNGLPPVLGSIQRDDTGLPPTFGTLPSTIGAVIDPVLLQSPAPEVTGNQRAPRATRKQSTVPATTLRKNRASQKIVADQENGISEAGESEAGPSTLPLPTRQKTKSTPRAAKRKRSPVNHHSQMDGDIDGNESVDGSTQGVTRKAKPKRKKMFSQPEFGEAQSDDMIGRDIQEDRDTMKDIVTTLGGEGRISKRAIELDVLLREKQARRRVELDTEKDKYWQMKQVLRRQARAVRNAERAKLREQARVNGEGSDTIDPDSEDSEVDFDVMPERLTPPSSPEPVAEEEDNEDEEEAVEAEDALFLPDGNEAPSEVGAVDVEEDEDIAALRAAGFILRPDGDDEEMEDYDPEQMSYDEYQALMERHEANRRRNLATAQNREIVEEDRVNMVNNASFNRKRTRHEKWTDDETELFYHVLGEVGENYGLMAHYFPGRTMNQVKRKGIRENKINPERVTAAIYSKRPMDITYLTKTVGYDPEAPMDKEREFIAEAEAESERMKKEDSEVNVGQDGDEEERDEEEAEAELEDE